MDAIETVGLTKKFDSLTAVDSLNLSIPQGEVFGLLGPNGAGKTTTLNILCTILRPTFGFAKVNGVDVMKDPDAVRKSIGIVFQDPALDVRLTARENLEMHAELYEVDSEVASKRITELLALVELDSRANDLVKTYSGGMKRRLEIARGLIHHPSVLFLDEPTIGLDPQTRSKIWGHIERLSKEEDITIVLTTHYMEEAEKLCDRVGIIDHGKIVALGKPSELIHSVGEDIASLTLEDNSKAKEFESLKSVKKVFVGETVRLVLVDGASSVPSLFDFAAKKGIKIRSLTLQTPTLNDVFLHFVGREIREEHADGKTLMRLRMRRRGM
ncbi:Trehalose/maltose import ATP-binding protein MalK [uncultured archaeon]|nr:Trehalose/maltose import ATP-binding protein MalK [uncultured archaeon]